MSRSSSARSRRMSVGGAGDLAAQGYGAIPPLAPAAPDAPEAPRGPPMAIRNGRMPENAIPRSFSARSRKPPPESAYAYQNAGYGDGYGAPREKAQYQRPPTQRGPALQPTFANAPPMSGPSQASPVDARQPQGSSEMPPRPTSRSQAPPLSRSNTVQSVKGGLPVDRSPLQQLETRFVGLSKEEKRARMMEAERKLREKNARRDSQRTAQPAPLDSKPEARESLQNVERQANDASSLNSGDSYQRRQPSISRKAIPPGQPQYATVQAAQEPQYAHAQGQGQGQGQGPRGAIPPMQRQPSQSQRNARFSAPGNGHVIQPGQYSQGDTQRVPPVAGKPRQGSIQAQRPIRPDYNQRPTTSAGRQPPAAQNNRPVTSYNEQTFLDPDTGVRPTHFAGENLNHDVEKEQNPEQDSTRDPSPVLKKKTRQTVSFNIPPPTPPPLDEWKRAPVARLSLAHRDFERIDVDKGKAWWEQDASSNRRKSRALPSNYRKPGPKVNETNRFDPLLFLKCGPLLRYLGIRKTTVDGPQGSTEQEVWRGSIMIVTKDSLSSLETPPTLRLFSQPMDLLPPPPRQISGEGTHLAPEYVDPIAGVVKVGRDGRALYVKPVEHLEEEVDLSAVESEDGLFESSPSPINYATESHAEFKAVPSNRLHPVNGENSGLYEEIQAFRLYSDAARDVTFWRFNIEVELTDKQERIAYRINQGPAIGFWVPAKGQSMNIMFHSCNGFSLSVDRDKFSGPDPLWRDVLNEHQTRPFHVMIGGGDQIYCDKVLHESDLFEEWTRIKNPHSKQNAPFSAEFKAELETFYLNHYADWFSHGLFSLANCQIPMVNIWDDHDIIDGFGSYPDHLMRSPVFSGLGNVAFKYYMLFQHQSVPQETEADEPSWLLGADLGPYIKEKSRSLFMSFGKGVSFLGIDCRTERMVCSTPNF
jgi:PhoD related phosphatase